MSPSLLGALVLGPSMAVPAPADCPTETIVRPGRWRVESVRPGETPTTGVADIVRLEGGCVLMERLLLHFDDGTSHHVVFVRSLDLAAGEPRMLQIGDHPLFLVWRAEPDAEAFRTTRSTDDGEVELRWRIRAVGRGFERELMVRRDGASDWSSSEVITYRPMPSVEDRDRLPALRPGPFHDPDACDGPAYRAMDHLIGHWHNDEWVRERDAWVPGSVSDVSVRPVIGGCALLEEHPIYENGELRDRLLLFRGYDPAGNGWRQVVFARDGAVREWDVRRREDGWLLTPAGGEREGHLRILEREGSGGIVKTVEALGDGGRWRVRRLIRYVPW